MWHCPLNLHKLDAAAHGWRSLLLLMRTQLQQVLIINESATYNICKRIESVCLQHNRYPEGQCR